MDVICTGTKIAKTLPPPERPAWRGWVNVAEKMHNTHNSSDLYVAGQGT